jgi:hypothetical protein
VRLGLVLLVVGGDARVGIPGHLLGIEERAVEAVERLVADARGHDRLHVEHGEEGLPHLAIGHHAFLVVRHGGDPTVRLGDLRLQGGLALDAVDLVRPDLLGVVIFTRLHTSQAHRSLGHRDEIDLVDVRGALASVAVGRIGAGRVLFETGQAYVPIGLVLDEAIGTGADVFLDLPVARGRHHLLGIDGPPVVGRAQGEEERAGRLLEIDDDGVRVLGLEPLDVLPYRLGGRTQLGPVLERRYHVSRGHLLAVVEAHALAQGDGVAAAVVPHRMTFREHGNGVLVLVVGVEGLVHVPGYLLGDYGGGRMQIEGGRLADEPGLEHPARAWLVLSDGPGRGGEDQQREQCRGANEHEALLRAV